jgi:hypothetical protein
MASMCNYVSISAAAKILSISRQAVFAKIQKGQLSATRICGQWKICRRVLNREVERKYGTDGEHQLR